MQLSILDQAPVLQGATAKTALEQSLKLACKAETLGYARYWIAEHHDLPGLACSAPEIMLSYIGAKTKSIRIGSGATLLPHYKPYKVAEVFNMLATLFPNRIDLGIGRAPGGDAQASMALSGNFLENVRNMPKTVKELLHFLFNDHPHDHMYANLTASPLPPVPPELWILGTSKKSALLAAEHGTAYAFGQFMSSEDGRDIIKTYKKQFQRKRMQTPKAIVAISAICAETSEKAEQLAIDSISHTIQQNNGQSVKKEEINQYKQNMVIGAPNEVADQLNKVKTWYDADEIMIITNTGNYEDRLKSYELIANVMKKTSCS